jgi:hypothetical protein
MICTHSHQVIGLCIHADRNQIERRLCRFEHVNRGCGGYVLLFLFCVLLHEDAMFMHTQKRPSKAAGPTGQLVHCPVRVGGKGNVT